MILLSHKMSYYDVFHHRDCHLRKTFKKIVCLFVCLFNFSTYIHTYMISFGSEERGKILVNFQYN
jgi:hypothetical protein